VVIYVGVIMIGRIGGMLHMSIKQCVGHVMYPLMEYQRKENTTLMYVSLVEMLTLLPKT
jgi:hypothetical protein